MYPVRYYLFGCERITGGIVNHNYSEIHFRYIPRSYFWKLLWKTNKPLIYIEKSESSIQLRINDTFYCFDFKPICPFWIDTDGKIIKSKRFHLFKFQINQTKGNTMNDHVSVQMEEAHKLSEKQEEFLAKTPKIEEEKLVEFIQTKDNVGDESNPLPL